MYAVTGYGSKIITELCGLTSEEVIRIGEDDEVLRRATKFVLAAGVLYGKKALEMHNLEVFETFAVNCAKVIQLCEYIFKHNARARVCIVGSESGFTGSYDQIYAAAKAGVHQYAKNRHVMPGQQIFAVAPTIIADAGMTLRRKDYPEILEKRKTVTSRRVAEIIHRHLTSMEINNNFVDRILC